MKRPAKATTRRPDANTTARARWTWPGRKARSRNWEGANGIAVNGVANQPMYARAPNRAPNYPKLFKTVNMAKIV